MAFIPAGTFLMGSVHKEPESFREEGHDLAERMPSKHLGLPGNDRALAAAPGLSMATPGRLAAGGAATADGGPLPALALGGAALADETLFVVPCAVSFLSCNRPH
jgi:hypothetical protein